MSVRGGEEFRMGWCGDVEHGKFVEGAGLSEPIAGNMEGLESSTWRVWEKR